MYKIYVNDTPIFLLNTDQAADMLPDVEKKLVGRYLGKTKFLLSYIDMLEKTQRFDAVILHAPDADVLFEDFKSLFKRIDAAGGAVLNPAGELLMIYRLGFWDLPKGKVDPGETVEAAAVREVEEETGLQQIERGAALPATWHTYRTRKGKRILKKTYWFRMKTNQLDLTPQLEEDIEKAVWRDPQEFLESSDQAYGSINDVIAAI